MISFHSIFILVLIGNVHSLNLPEVDHEADIPAMKQEIKDLKSLIVTMNSTLGDVQAKLEKYNTSSDRTLPVAFTACLGASLRTLGPHQPMEFDHVILNEGGAYDPRHGIFRAPATGIYRFVVTFLNQPGHEIFAEIVKDGNRLGLAYSDDDQHSEGTVQVNVKLQSGEDVWCRNALSTRSMTLHPDGMYSCFSGFQI